MCLTRVNVGTAERLQNNPRERPHLSPGRTTDDQARKIQTTESLIWLEELRREDVAKVGGKNSSLGEMISTLGAKGIKVPGGFATTSDAYRAFVAANGLRAVIARRWPRSTSIASPCRRPDRPSARRSRPVIGPRISPKTSRQAYAEMSARTGQDRAVGRRALIGHRRGSAGCQFRRPAGDLPECRRPKALLASCRRCYASLFTDRAITYRNLNGFDHEEVALSIGVQQMVRSDLSSSGVMFSIDTETGFDKFVLITGAWGLGENVVQGAVDPDEFQVFKPFLDNPDLSPIVARDLGAKEIKMIYGAAR
jgi:pyruvate,water dikinase